MPSAFAFLSGAATAGGSTPVVRIASTFWLSRELPHVTHLRGSPWPSHRTIL